MVDYRRFVTDVSRRTRGVIVEVPAWKDDSGVFRSPAYEAFEQSGFPKGLGCFGSPGDTPPYGRSEAQIARRG